MTAGEEKNREQEENGDGKTNRQEGPFKSRRPAGDRDEHLRRDHRREVREEIRPPGGPNGLDMGRRDRRGHDHSRGCPRNGSEGTASYACRASRYKYGVAATWPIT